MTTIAWDGVELVADSRSSHYTVQDGETVLIGDSVDGVVKIINAAGAFSWQGHEVLAVGVAGTTGLIDLLQGMVKQAAEYNATHGTNDRIPLEMPSLYKLWFDGGVEFNLMLVLKNAIALVGWAPRFGTNNLQQAVYERDTKGSVIVIGSGANAIAPVIQQDGWTARKAIAYTATHDKGTGGPLTVWRDGQLTAGVVC